MVDFPVNVVFPVNGAVVDDLVNIFIIETTVIVVFIIVVLISMSSLVAFSVVGLCVVLPILVLIAGMVADVVTVDLAGDVDFSQNG